MAGFNSPKAWYAKMKKREYQEKVVDRLLSVIKDLSKAFLQMPTGTGKTITAFKFIMKLFGKSKKPVTINWVVHQKQLVYQAYCEFLNEVAKISSENVEKGKSVYLYKHNNITITFSTWQTLRTQKIHSDLLIIDECHKGSALSKGDEKREHKSFHTIFKLAPKHLYISATPSTLDGDLFPDMLITYKREGKVYNTVKEEYKAVYNSTDAARDGYIANVRFFAIQSADTLKIQKLNEEETLTFKSLEDGARKVEKNKVNLKHQQSRRSLNKSVRDSVLHNFFLNEVVKGELKSPAIVICQRRYKSGDHTLCAKEMAKEIKLWARHYLGPKHGTGKTFVDYITGDVKDKHEKIAKFKRGEIKILCVVGMLQEGFNYPALGAMVDFAPCFDTNVRDATQRIGRPARPYEGKLFARYYYPDIIQNYINVLGVRKDLDNKKASSHFAKLIASQTGRDQSEITEEEIQAAKNSTMKIAKFKDDSRATDENGEIAFKNQTLVTGKLSLKKDKKQTYISTEVDYIITDADNSDPEANIKVQDLYEMLSVRPTNFINWNALSTKELIKIAKGEMYV